VRDVIPDGSRWLERDLTYSTGKPGSRNPVIHIRNDFLHFRQDLVANMGRVGLMQLTDAAGKRMFWAHPLAEWWTGNSQLGYYTLLGTAAGRRQRWADILARGGIYYRDPRLGDWVLWGNSAGRLEDRPGGLLGLECWHIGMPDWTKARTQDRFQWRYNFGSDADVEFQLARHEPVLRLQLRPLEPSWPATAKPFHVLWNLAPQTNAFALAETGWRALRTGAELQLTDRRNVTLVFCDPGTDALVLGLHVVVSGPLSDAKLTLLAAPKTTKFGVADLTFLNPEFETPSEITIALGLTQGIDTRTWTAEPARIAHCQLPRILQGLLPGQFDFNVTAARRVYIQGENVDLAKADMGTWPTDVRWTVSLRERGRDAPLTQETAQEDLTTISVPTGRLAPGRYAIVVEARTAEETLSRDWEFYVARPYNPDFFTRQVYHYGGIDFAPLAAAGFNRVYGGIGNPVPGGYDSLALVCELAAWHGLRVTGILQWAHLVSKHFPKAPRPWCPCSPKVKDLAQRFARSFAAKYASFPALDVVGYESEVGNRLHRCAACQAEAKAEIGLAELPVPEKERAREPGILPAADPYVAYMAWWNSGQAGNPQVYRLMTQAIAEVEPKLRTMHDEGYMYATYRDGGSANSVFGAWDGCSVIQKWSYSPPVLYLPFISKVLRAVRRPGQDVWHNFQLLWKAGWVSPEHHAVTPDICREVTWLVLAQGVDGYSHWGYHLVDTHTPSKTDGKPSTNCRATLEEIARLSRQVVLPFGSLVSACRRETAAVGIVYTFTDQLFPFGYYVQEHAAAKYDYALARGHVATDVVLENALTDDGPLPYQALVLANVRWLRASVRDALAQYIAAGGTVFVDPEFALALDDVIRVPPEREPLLEQLERRGIRRPATAEHADAIISVLVGENVRYLFVVNDRRAPGPWVGEHGKIKGVGEELHTMVHIDASARPVVYELTRGGQVRTNESGPGRICFAAHLAPAGAQVFALYPTALTRPRLVAPEGAVTGSVVPITVQIDTVTGQPAPGLQPVDLTVEDPAGAHTDLFRRYRLARRGRLSVKLPVPDNAPPGVWIIRVRDLTTGLRSRAFVRVTKGQPSVSLVLSSR